MARHVLIDRCNRCSTKGVSVTLISERMVPRETNSGYLIEVFGICGICTKTMILRVNTHNPSVTQVSDAYLTSNERLVSILPLAETAAAPEFVPPAVAKPFVEGVESILNGQWNAGGIMLRRAIERAVKDIDAAGKGDLKDRINALVSKGLIIKPMADWAHEVRLGGNEAVHDEDDLTKEEAVLLRGFADAFLEAAYTMPTRVASGKAAAMAEAKKRKGTT